MTSTLILDKSQPELAELVSKWQDGGEYELTIRVRQMSSDDAAANFRVIEVTPEEVPEEAPAKPQKRAPKSIEKPETY